MTPKQALRDHITHHHGKAGRAVPTSWTHEQLARWHARAHHHRWTNHYHAGPNTGPEQRPPGWFTGEDAVHLRRSLSG